MTEYSRKGSKPKKPDSVETKWMASTSILCGKFSVLACSAAVPCLLCRQKFCGNYLKNAMEISFELQYFFDSVNWVQC